MPPPGLPSHRDVRVVSLTPPMTTPAIPSLTAESSYPWKPRLPRTYERQDITNTQTQSQTRRYREKRPLGNERHREADAIWKRQHDEADAVNE